MNKKTMVIIGIAALAIATLAYSLFQRQPGADKGNPTVFGNVDIRDVSLAFRVAGRVIKVAVDEGAQVRAGAVLATLDVEPLNNSFRTAQASVAAITARNAFIHQGARVQDKAQSRAKLQAAQAVLTETERHLARQHELLPEGATTQRAVDTAQSARDQAAAQVTVVQQQLQQLNEGFRKEEVAESDAQLAQARAALDAALLAVKDATLLAPSDGVILTRAVEVGSMVQAGTPAFSLSLTSPVWVRAYVGEPQLGRFAPGTKISVSTDARPGKPYRGVVGFVSPTAEFTPKSVETTDLRTALVYRMRVVVEDPDSQLRQGMPVTLSLAP